MSHSKKLVLVAVGTMLMVLLLFADAASQTKSAVPATQTKGGAAPAPESKSTLFSYRNVSIGMKADDARKALGEPKEKADDQDFYMFAEIESAQVYYDANRSVTAISITYFGDLSKVPSAKMVLGEEAEPKPDGSIFKLVRFSKAGFWISYSKTAGDAPTVSITLQKI